MLPKHISAYTLIISLIIATKCEQLPPIIPPIPLPPSAVLSHAIVTQPVPLPLPANKEIPSHYPLSYPHPNMPPHPDYEDSDSDPAYDSSQEHQHSLIPHGHTSQGHVNYAHHAQGTHSQKGAPDSERSKGKKYIGVTPTKHTSYKAAGHSGYGQYGEGCCGTLWNSVGGHVGQSTPEIEYTEVEKGDARRPVHGHNGQYGYPSRGNFPSGYDKHHDHKGNSSPGHYNYGSGGGGTGFEKYGHHLNKHKDQMPQAVYETHEVSHSHYDTSHPQGYGHDGGHDKDHGHGSGNGHDYHASGGSHHHHPHYEESGGHHSHGGHDGGGHHHGGGGGHGHHSVVVVDDDEGGWRGSWKKMMKSMKAKYKAWKKGGDKEEIIVINTVKGGHHGSHHGHGHGHNTVIITDGGWGKKKGKKGGDKSEVIVIGGHGHNGKGSGGWGGWGGGAQVTTYGDDDSNESDDDVRVVNVGGGWGGHGWGWGPQVYVASDKGGKKKGNGGDDDEVVVINAGHGGWGHGREIWKSQNNKKKPVGRIVQVQKATTWNQSYGTPPPNVTTNFNNTTNTNKNTGIMGEISATLNLLG